MEKTAVITTSDLIKSLNAKHFGKHVVTWSIINIDLSPIDAMTSFELVLMTDATLVPQLDHGHMDELHLLKRAFLHILFLVKVSIDTVGWKETPADTTKYW